MSGNFCRLESDIVRRALRHDALGRAFDDVIALDKSVELEVRKLPFPQNASSLSHLFESLDFFDADVQKSDRRTFDVEKHTRHRAAHGREIDEMCFVRANRGAN